MANSKEMRTAKQVLASKSEEKALWEA